MDLGGPATWRAADTEVIYAQSCPIPGLVTRA